MVYEPHQTLDGNRWEPNLDAEQLARLPERWLIAFRHLQRRVPAILDAIQKDAPKPTKAKGRKPKR